jgi:quercetin dioxygenase-like cupin family protein
MSFLSFLFAIALQVQSPVWGPAPPSMPKGTQMAVLEGDPKTAGMFTIRLKVPAGITLPKHTHPRAERVTILSGSVRVHINDKDTTFTTGAFYVNPPGEPHTVTFVEETVMQLTCEGPWGLDYVD